MFPYSSSSWSFGCSCLVTNLTLHHPYLSRQFVFSFLLRIIMVSYFSHTHTVRQENNKNISWTFTNKSIMYYAYYILLEIDSKTLLFFWYAKEIVYNQPAYSYSSFWQQYIHKKVTAKISCWWIFLEIRQTLSIYNYIFYGTD